MATATAQAHLAMDARGWDEAEYRRGILRECDRSCRTLFRAVFFDHGDDGDPDVLLAAASSDGSLSSCISSAAATPVQAHSGPPYDDRFYPDPQQPLLFSCGDDGHIRGWRWRASCASLTASYVHYGALALLLHYTCLLSWEDHLEPVLDLVNPQHEGPWGAQSPIPENNAIAINKQEGSIFSAAGDACAYCWDVVCILLRRVVNASHGFCSQESGKCKMTFKGQTDYLQCCSS